MLAIERFMTKGGGFVSSAQDSSLESLELGGILPSNYHRTFVTILHDELLVPVAVGF